RHVERPPRIQLGIVLGRGRTETPKAPLRFVGPLHELVAAGLYRPTLEALCRGGGEDVASPIDRTYLLKMLDEEVGRQFGHPLRPLVELVLNGADAGPGQEACCVVDPGVDLGRFGVGFFSVLGLGLADPMSFSLHVETGDGAEGWSICVVASGNDVAALSAAVRGTPPRSGTRIKVTSALLDAGPVRAYLRDAL